MKFAGHLDEHSSASAPELVKNTVSAKLLSISRRASFSLAGDLVEI